MIGFVLAQNFGGGVLETTKPFPTTSSHVIYLITSDIFPADISRGSLKVHNESCSIFRAGP